MEEKNFFKRLFDFSFSEFITLDIIKIVYIILLIFAGLFTLGAIIAGFTSHWAAGVLALIFSPVIFGLLAIIYRIWCEIILILFRIEMNTRK